ncbi:serine/threonine-protein phosphatase [Nocardioides sp. W3-2-3]|uniref:PP2C family protein-serine/threonine phosphatase n=1 Tax=Nocardioides convexus TaxID=2712224 RepID=UPI0024182078|nr:PP2C family protein-serine/threonine phosphatase [Nocardioides convexus]NHA01721.1 serine/threonine-protein phosphatase [Nocardioides convexus]
MITVSRRWFTSDRGIAVLLAVFSAGVLVGIAMCPDDVPITLAFLPLVIAVLMLSSRALPWFAAYMVLVLSVASALQDSWTARTAISVVLMYVITLAVIAIARSRRGLSVARMRGESMLVDLRDRILAQGEIPALPPQWLVQSALASAGGSAFAGDFFVATGSERGGRIESGRGRRVRQGRGRRHPGSPGSPARWAAWSARCRRTASCRRPTTTSSSVRGRRASPRPSTSRWTSRPEPSSLRSAGHPPAVQRHAGSGRWQVLRAEGPVLGIVEDVAYDAYRGRLAPGDSLLLYTDGMVEEPRRDIGLGIDEMMGTAEALLRDSWDGLADRLVGAVGSPDDDRALLLVHRRP